MDKMKEYIVSENESGTRIDKFVAEKVSGLSRSFMQKLISDGHITIDGEQCKPSQKVHPGSVIKVNIISKQTDELPKAENIPLAIVYEDDEVIVVNKPAGMVVHPAPGNRTGTLVNAIMSHLPSSDEYDDSDIEDVDSTDVSLISPQRPGIVHRLDKGTSGLLVIAKTVNAYYNLVSQVKQHSMTRRYIAVVCGMPKHDEGTIIAPIGRSSRNRKKMAVTPIRSKEATTHFKILEKYVNFCVIEARLETGRTHQIRVHFAYIGHPIVGDPDYGGKNRALSIETSESLMNVIENFPRQALHAQMLGFSHPKTSKYLEFSSEIPQDMQELMDSLHSELAMEQ